MTDDKNDQAIPPGSMRAYLEPEDWFRLALPDASPETHQRLAQNHRRMVGQRNELFARSVPTPLSPRPIPTAAGPTVRYAFPTASPELRVTTRYNADLIESIVSTPGIDRRISEVNRDVIWLKEEGVRKALIALGWTPPKDDEA